MKDKGFTLLELLLVSAILSLFLGLALPASTTLIKSVKMAMASNSLHRTLKFARSEAITRSKAIRICASRDGTVCSKQENWASGWLVYIDESGKSIRTGDDPILRFTPGQTGIDISYNLSGYTVKFNEVGRLGRQGSFSVCDPSGKVEPNRLSMIHSGRVRQTAEGARCP